MYAQKTPTMSAILKKPFLWMDSIKILLIQLDLVAIAQAFSVQGLSQTDPCVGIAVGQFDLYSER